MNMDRKERDRQLRENDILDAAEHVFATKGYHKASISDIAGEAQYAVGTIYLYFKDKESLYLTLIEKKIKNLFLTVKERVDKVDNAKEKIRVLVEAQFSYFQKNEDFFRIFFSEGHTVKDKIAKSSIERMLKYIDFIAQVIKEAQKSGIIKRGFDSKRTAFILAAMMNATIFPWLRDKSQENNKFEDLSKFVLEVFYEGVGAK